MRREWKTEWMKVRYRKIWLVLLGFLAMTFLWAGWVVNGGKPEEIRDGYRWILTNLAIINTIFMPTMTAMLASRLCDTEVKGNTIKLLCTMETKGRLFDMKLLTGACYLAIYMAAELGALLCLGYILGFGEPLKLRHALCFLIQNFLVSLVILIFQQVLSFYFENQIMPLAAGLFGSFAGLFSWFLPKGILHRVLIWGYYCLLSFLGSYWEEETRIMYFYDVPLDRTALYSLLVLLVLGYLAGKYLFLRKEI